VAPLRVTAENSWILRWTCVREVYLKGSSRTVTLHLPPSFIYIYIYIYIYIHNVSLLLIKVNLSPYRRFWPVWPLRWTSTSAMALSVWKRPSHTDEFHELASHVLYCPPVNLINCTTERCILHASLQKNVLNWNWSVNDLVATFEGGKGERGVCVCVCGGGEVAIIYRLASSRCLE